MLNCILPKILDALHTYQGSTLESTAEINTTSIILKAHEGSRQTLNITSEKIDSRVKSGGFLNISGKATSHRVSILGGRDLRRRKTSNRTNNG